LVFARISALSLGLLLPAILLAAACADNDDQGASTAPATTAASTRAAVPLPADYPEDFPAYPNAIIHDSVRYLDQAIAVYETSDSRQDVAGFYRNALAEPPWEVLLESDDPSQNLLVINFKHLEQPIQGVVTVIAPSADNPYTNVALRFTVPRSVGPPLPTAPPLPTDQPAPTASGGG